MTDNPDDDALLGRLDRLVAMAKTIRQPSQRQDRRLILALENDLRMLRTALGSRKDALAQKLNSAGAGSRAMSAYSRTASLARSVAAPTNK
jgi:hypothetical protein